MTEVWVYHRVDWWSFGILIYELLYGFTPFRGKKRDETFNNILKRPLNFPEQPEVSEACKVHQCYKSSQTCAYMVMFSVLVELALAETPPAAGLTEASSRGRQR